MARLLFASGWGAVTWAAVGAFLTFSLVADPWGYVGALCMIVGAVVGLVAAVRRPRLGLVLLAVVALVPLAWLVYTLWWLDHHST